MDKRFEPHARLAAIIFLLIGCFFVLRPFLAAMLFAACVGISSWPLYLLLLERLKGRRNLAAAIMTLSLLLVIVLPLALVTYNLADNVSRIYEQIRAALEAGGLHPPAWLASIPVVGDTIAGYVERLLADREELLNLGKTMLEPARHFLASGGILLGTGLAQTSLAVFVSFFLYRDGQQLSRALMTGAGRIIGDSAPGVGLTISRTVRGVMYGLLGTALAQALVAVIGFLIAGVPAVALLGVATFIFSLIPVGPPLIWGGAAIWLFNDGQTGWGIFMLVWGALLISGVDNVVKPMLISRGSSLPFLLVLLGVLGGVLAFGFVGIFIGPTLLAVLYSLLQTWTVGETTMPQGKDTLTLKKDDSRKSASRSRSCFGITLMSTMLGPFIFLTTMSKSTKVMRWPCFGISPSLTMIKPPTDSTSSSPSSSFSISMPRMRSSEKMGRLALPIRVPSLCLSQSF